MSYSTGLQHIGYNNFGNKVNGFSNAAVTAVTVLANWLFPRFWRFAFRPLLRPMILPVVYRFGE